MASITTDSLKFLKQIKKNNNREWFKAHKDIYTIANDNMKEFLASVVTELNKTDDAIDKTKLFRIYRDVRFSKDKTPYTSHFSMSLSREGAFRRGGYYIRIAPGETMVGGGFYRPESSDLKLIRDHISFDSEPLKKIITAKKFIEAFGQLQGEQLKNVPRGYDKEHSAADLLKFKSMYVFKTFSDTEVIKPNFLKEVVKTYKVLRPYFDYMSEILTHDLDGVPLYK